MKEEKQCSSFVIFWIRLVEEERQSQAVTDLDKVGWWKSELGGVVVVCGKMWKSAQVVWYGGNSCGLTRIGMR